MHILSCYYHACRYPIQEAVPIVLSILQMRCLLLPFTSSFNQVLTAVQTFYRSRRISTKFIERCNILPFMSYFNQVLTTVQHFTFHVVFQQNTYSGANVHPTPPHSPIKSLYYSKPKAQSPTLNLQHVHYVLQ